jgi:Lrp/AsnC ligand binding domain
VGVTSGLDARDNSITSNRSGVGHVLDAYILTESHLDNAPIVAAQVQNVPGVWETEIVTGPYDVVARARARDMDELVMRVAFQLQALPGVMRTATCIKTSFSLSGLPSRSLPTSHWRARWNRHHGPDTNGPLARVRRRRVHGPYTPDPNARSY